MCMEIENTELENKIKLGQFYTITNPFNIDIFYKWADFFKKDLREFTEPFAGANNIVKMIQELGFNQPWDCYDIEPASDEEINGYIVQKRDTIKNYPSQCSYFVNVEREREIRVAITNPPYLAKNSATRKGMEFPDTEYDDLYKVALDVMLQNEDYVAAIIPESFITSNLFHNRLYAVVSLTCKMFSDTECPVCLALFIPAELKSKLKLDNDFMIYRQNIKLNNYKNIKDLLPNQKHHTAWKFNDKEGNIGIKCIDGTKEPSIEFVDGATISSDKIKESSRSLTRVSGLPDNIELSVFIAECNKILNDFREKTSDVLLTSFKGLRKDNCYRRRLDFKTAKAIMDLALDNILQEDTTNEHK